MNPHPNYLRVQSCMDGGLSCKEISQRLGMNSHTVSFWKDKIKHIHNHGQPLKLKDDCVNRAQWESFARYWKARPYHFEQPFGNVTLHEAFRECRSLLKQVRYTGSLSAILEGLPADKDMSVYSIGYGDR